jgi:hypothetical protein
MPRPTRKPKRFNPSNAESNPSDAPVISTPLHPKQSTTNPPPLASPELSPIQRDNEFTIYGDENKSTIPEQDHFGFGRVKGVKKTFVPIQIDSDDADDDLDDENDVEDGSVKDEDDDEDIYGEPYVAPTPTEAEESSKQEDSSPVLPTPKKKSISRLRTSQLLPLLPTRRKRQPPRPQKKQPPHDCSDTELDVPIKSKSVKKRRVVDKENEGPEEIDSEEERQIEERRKIVKKFAEVDNWEMAFETVDLSFSSQ